MVLFKIRSPIDQLEDLLAEEKNALLNGDFVFLNRIISTKEKLISRIQNDTEILENLSELKEKILHNQVLLEAAGKGIQTVSDFLSNKNRPSVQLHTYDKSGQLNQYSPCQNFKPNRT